MVRAWHCLTASALVAVNAAHADDRSYLGAWTVTSSMAAPWAAAGEQPDASDLKALMGKTIVFQPARIAAPQRLTCAKPHYQVVAVPPEGLFQGSLTDPAKQAATLGFAASIRTLQTGCEFDFHFVTGAKAMFALNDRIYVMDRRPH